MKQFRLFLRLLLLFLTASFFGVSCNDECGRIEALPFRMAVDGKWGLMSTSGEILLSGVSFDNRPSCVVNGMYTVPDKDSLLQLYSIEQPRVPVVPRRFYRLGYFFEEVTFAQESPQSPIVMIDKMGRNIFSTEQLLQFRIELVYNFRNGRALFVTREGKYGYLDTQGKVVIPPLYDFACDFKEDRALVGFLNQSEHMGYQVIDKQGKVCFAFHQEDCMIDDQPGEGLWMFKDLRSGYCAYLDKYGIPALYLPQEVKDAYSFEDGIAPFRTENGMGVVSRKGDIVVPAIYEHVFMLGQDRMAFVSGEVVCLLDENGKKIAEFEGKSVGRFYEEGWAIVSQEEGYRWMNRNGRMQEKIVFEIVEDEEALGIKKEAFWCNTMQKSPIPKSVKKEVNEEKKIKEKMVGRPMEQRAWKEISRQSPFYEEMKKVVAGQLEESDADNRRIILNYVEHLRTSYTTKDIDFLEQLFSENALIIVGTVINVVPQVEQHYLPEKQVIYNVKNKREYLKRLKVVFKSNRNIDLKFSDFKIMRHPTQPDIYGVRLRQGYSSDSYSDDGYLFLLWDFQDKMAPKIHVRTWQPAMKENQVPLPEDEVFDIRNFNLQ